MLNCFSLLLQSYILSAIREIIAGQRPHRDADLIDAGVLAAGAPVIEGIVSVGTALVFGFVPGDFDPLVDCGHHVDGAGGPPVADVDTDPL